ncbi:hypothetical protein BZG29_05470 [Janthinobacterium sp. LM6]|nr:hypothetical protein BZG29_05470 [Janthinobacterium sp. LM6]
MQPADWISFIAQFAYLNRRQRQAGMALLRGNAPHDATVALLESVAQPLALGVLAHGPCLRAQRRAAAAHARARAL